MYLHPYANVIGVTVSGWSVETKNKWESILLGLAAGRVDEVFEAVVAYTLTLRRE
jgi:hypothetical protein